MRLAIRGSAARDGSTTSPDAGLPAFTVAARQTTSVVAVDRRHTWRVAILKRVLPAIGVSLLLLIAMWPRLVPLWERMRLSFPPIDLRDAQELRMVNPRYSGIDREGRPFVVTAASGRQIPDRQDLMSLQAPVAEIKLRSGAKVWARAVTGVYQSQASMLDLFGDVTVTHQDGTRFLTQTARVNVAQNAAEGSDPVSGNGPAGEIKAQGFRIIDKGETIIFTGNAAMVLNAAKKVAPKHAPPAVPAQVAALAAQVESEAKLEPPGHRSRGRLRRKPPSPTRNRALGAPPGRSANVPNRRAAHRSRIGQAALAVAILLSLGRFDPGLAQIGLSGPQGGDDGPIRIQADSGIEWQQNQRIYIARGNAMAARGNSEVRADTLIAHYREKAGAKTDAKGGANPSPNTEGGLLGPVNGEGGGNTEIIRVEAIGNVVLKHEASTVTGERAVYDIDQGIALVTGNNLKLTTATDVVTARDSLEWHDSRQIAVARGDAVATRESKTIKADILTAYMHKSATPQATGAARAGSQAPTPRSAPAVAQPGLVGGGGQNGESRISRVDAQGHVIITDALNTGRGDYGVYNGDTGIATLIGNVIIQRGANVIQGQRGVMDLNKNIARMIPGGGSGEAKQRVQGLLVRDQDKSGAAPAGDRKLP